MSTNPDPQLTALAWIVFGTLVACVTAIVALVRSGRSVPPLGGVSMGGPGSGAESGPPPRGSGLRGAPRPRRQ